MLKNKQKLPTSMHNVSGFSCLTTKAGISKKDREDLLVCVFSEGSQLASVYTKSTCPSHAVSWCKKLGKSGRISALVINSGNANAFNGAIGDIAVEKITASIADRFSIPQRQVYCASTGVIGEALAYKKIVNKIDEMSISDAQDWPAAAKAIMTTDIFPKAVTNTIDCEHENIVINGIAKGSGMIAPNMGTMLSLIVTDAIISSDKLQAMLADICEKTFNAISVDGDTSTSDSVFLIATGKKRLINYEQFEKSLHSVCEDLARQIAIDGEGAERLITVNVKSANDFMQARNLGLSIAASPLVKTAVAGCDPNWGRIVMAVGKSLIAIDINKIKIWIGDYLVAENGAVARSYNEAKVANYMQTSDEIVFTVDIAKGASEATAWGCDLTKEYISINADYRS